MVLPDAPDPTFQLPTTRSSLPCPMLQTQHFNCPPLLIALPDAPSDRPNIPGLWKLWATTDSSITIAPPDSRPNIPGLWKLLAYFDDSGMVLMGKVPVVDPRCEHKYGTRFI